MKNTLVFTNNQQLSLSIFCDRGLRITKFVMDDKEISLNDNEVCQLLLHLQGNLAPGIAKQKALN